MTLLVLVLTTTSARADEPAPTQTDFYTWQIMLVDAAAVGLFVGGFAWGKSADRGYERPLGGALIATAGVGLWLGGPYGVHRVHDHPDAVMSFVARLVLPLGAGAIAGTAIRTCECGEHDEVIALAMLTGAGVAVIYDWVWLARSEVPVPYVAPVSGGNVVGVVTRF